MAKGTYSTSKMERLALALEDQGCRVRVTKSGWFIYFPNQRGTMNIHKTISDTKAVMAMRAKVKRAGLEWPGI